MSKNLRTYDLIQDYLNDKLSNDALADFEKKLSEEKDFAKYVQNHKIANAVIKNNELKAIKSALQNIHEENQNYGKNRPLLLGIILGLGLLLLAYFSSSIIDSSSNNTPIIETDQPLIVTDSEEESSVPERVESVERTKVEEITDRNIDINDNLNTKTEEINSFQPTAKSISNLELKSVSRGSIDRRERPNLLPAVQERKMDNIEGNLQFKEIICDPFEVSLQMDISPSCLDKNNGVLVILNDFKSAVHSFQIDNKKPQGDRLFTELTVGQHEIFVVDNRGCKSTPVKFNIAEISCQIILYPTQNIYWEIPQEITRGKDVDLEIYNAKSGALVFRQKLNSFEQNIWDARSTTGQKLPMGAYKYVYTFAGTKMTGDITILQ